MVQGQGTKDYVNKENKVKQIHLAGIDVGSKELVVKLEKSGKKQEGISTFDNTKAGHKKLIKHITKGAKITRVCMEATGIYHFELAMTLSNTKNVAVMVVNPKAIKHFAIASQSRTKTDAVDANLILSYLNKMDFVLWQPPAHNHLKIQAISRRIYQLKAEANRENNRRHAGEYKHELNDVIHNDIDVNIRHITKRIEMLEQQALKIIKSDEKLNPLFELLTSIKGIATTSGIQILSELACLPMDMTPEQWVAYAGLDPRAIESGHSFHKPRRITKSGNKYLRTALYMPAWVAVQKETHVKAFYTKLTDAGKKPLQAIVAVMRKLLHAIWGMFKHNSTWDGEKFYVIKNT